MEDRKRENKVEALREASRHRLAKETGEDVVKNAKKYYEFLQGDDE